MIRSVDVIPTVHDAFSFSLSSRKTVDVTGVTGVAHICVYSPNRCEMLGPFEFRGCERYGDGRGSVGFLGV